MAALPLEFDTLPVGELGVVIKFAHQKMLHAEKVWPPGGRNPHVRVLLGHYIAATTKYFFL